MHHLSPFFKDALLIEFSPEDIALIKSKLLESELQKENLFTNNTEGSNPAA